MEAGNYKDALSLLEKSLKMNVEVLGGDHMSNAAIFTVVSQVYAKQKDYDRAIQQLQHVEQIYLSHPLEDTEEAQQERQEQLGNTYLEMSRVFARANDTDNAIASQQRAFETFASMEKYEETDYLAEIATTLSELQDKAKMFHEALDSLRAVERILEHNHAGEISAKICKVKRNISLLFLKLDDNMQALDKLKQVEELERSLYGENSTQLGKTYKVIGTIHLLSKVMPEAREYLQRAQAIFELKGQMKLLKEVKSKLKLLQPGRYNMAFGDADNG